MNETSHHKVIERFASSGLPVFSKDVSILKSASNFTDDYMGASKVDINLGSESKYFFYHFYYDIKCDSNRGTIELQRNHHDDEGIGTTFNNCSLGQKFHDFESIKTYVNYFGAVVNRTVPNYKKFFTYINQREHYLRKDDKFDNSNQSDCVAFLHAMAAEGESEEDAQKKFEDHLQFCFAEFLFLGKEKREEAIFMLGIAFHGIMDSFTPSHMGFQKYTQQDMALHAQGDVLPFKNDIAEFDPGQFKKESPIGKIAFAIAKGYNSSDNINEIEFKMFKIFIDIFDFNQDTPDIKALLADSPKFGYTQHLPDGFEKSTIRSKAFFNNVIRKKKPGNNSFIYTEKAIQAIKSIYEILMLKRPMSYGDYKDEKENTIDGAVKLWREIYNHNEIKNVRERHLEQEFYAKIH